MTQLNDVYATTRKEKRWLVFTKAHITVGNVIYYPSVTNPLCIKIRSSVHSTEDYVVESYPIVTTDESTGWILTDTVGSFEVAKTQVIELAAVIGLNNVLLLRAVDLTSVLYPIT